MNLDLFIEGHGLQIRDIDIRDIRIITAEMRQAGYGNRECFRCGKKTNDDDARFCKMCGERMPDDIEITSVC